MRRVVIEQSSLPSMNCSNKQVVVVERQMMQSYVTSDNDILVTYYLTELRNPADGSSAWYAYVDHSEPAGVVECDTEQSNKWSPVGGETKLSGKPGGFPLLKFTFFNQ